MSVDTPRPSPPPPSPPRPGGPGRDERSIALALWLIVVAAIFAALLLGCGWGDQTGQSCGETNVGTSASPSWQFGCEVNR